MGLCSSWLKCGERRAGRHRGMQAGQLADPPTGRQTDRQAKNIVHPLIELHTIYLEIIRIWNCSCEIHYTGLRKAAVEVNAGLSSGHCVRAIQSCFRMAKVIKCLVFVKTDVSLCLT